MDKSNNFRQDISSPKNPSKHVQILMMNRKLMEDNLNFSDTFYAKLKELRVIPPTMIKDIEKTPKEDKIEVLVDLIGKMGAKGFSRFCDALDVSGNGYIGHHLREQAFNEVQEQNDFGKHIQEQYPQLRRVFTPVELRNFACHLFDKINELVAKNMWTMQSREKRRLSTERKSLIEEDIRMYAKMTKWKDQTKDLQKVIEEKDKEIMLLKQRVKDSGTSLLTTRSQHVTEQNKLIQSNEACERTISYTQDRLVMFDQQIKKLNIKILKLILPDQFAAIQNDADNVRVSRLEMNLEKLLSHIEKTERQLTNQVQRHKDERKRVFDALTIEDRQQDMSTAFHQCLSEIQTSLQPVYLELDNLIKVLEDGPPTSNKTHVKMDYLSTPKHIKPFFDVNARKNQHIVKQVHEMEVKSKKAVEEVKQLKCKHLQHLAELKAIKKQTKHNSKPVKDSSKHLPQTVPRNGVALKKLTESVDKVRFQSPVPSITSPKSERKKISHEKDESNIIKHDESNRRKSLTTRVETPYKGNDKNSNTSSSVSFSSEIAIIAEDGKNREDTKSIRKQRNGLSATAWNRDHSPTSSTSTMNRRRKYSIVVEPNIALLNKNHLDESRKISQASVISLSSDNPEAGFRKISTAISSSSSICSDESKVNFVTEKAM